MFAYDYFPVYARLLIIHGLINSPRIIDIASVNTKANRKRCNPSCSGDDWVAHCMAIWWHIGCWDWREQLVSSLSGWRQWIALDNGWGNIIAAAGIELNSLTYYYKTIFLYVIFLRPPIRPPEIFFRRIPSFGSSRASYCLSSCYVLSRNVMARL